MPALALSRADAEARANEALASRGIALSPEWRRTSIVRLATDEAARWEGHKFVWREAGRNTYLKLVGNMLVPPMWEVRYARFEGDVAERAEEWRVTIDGRGAVRQIQHALPESRAGARLARDNALALAQRTVREQFGLDPAALKEVGAEEKQLPARADWTFTFADPALDVGAGGRRND